MLHGNGVSPLDQEGRIYYYELKRRTFNSWIAIEKEGGRKEKDRERKEKDRERERKENERKRMK